jgi:hypothetical protein
MKDEQPTAVRDHKLLVGVALAVIALVLYQDNYGTFALLPIVPGLLSLMVLSPVGPPAVLTVLSFVLLAGNWLRGYPQWYRSAFGLADLVLVVATLVYVAAHWRLLGLVKQALPGDARRGKKVARQRLRGRWLLPGDAAKRTPARVPARDLFVLVGQAVLFGVAGYSLLIRLSLETAPPEVPVPDRAWQILLAAWAGGLALVGGYLAFTVLRWVMAGREEALLYLQDQLWSATRGEQRRIDRWVVWARLRRQRKEGA